MTKLHQIVALVAGKKQRAASSLAKCRSILEEPKLFNGLSRTYRPKDDDDPDILPSEHHKVQCDVGDVISEVSKVLKDLFDAVATLDVANCSAVANVEVDGVVLLKSVPATHLLFLEKQITELIGFLQYLPVLDPADDWTLDSNTGRYRTAAVETQRSKKVPKALVLYNATPEHPAQVQAYQEDVLTGFWVTAKFSGAISGTEKSRILDRARHVLEAVVSAREEANGLDVRSVTTGVVLDYVFGRTSAS